MIFSSVTFLFYFLPIFFLCYRFTPITYKNIVLVTASLIFYAWGEPIYVLLMLFSTIADYAYGLAIQKAYAKELNSHALFFLAASLTTNLSLLFFFKYTDFLIGSINQIFHTPFSALGLSLPIGISFYTFQTMSYSIDVYRKKVNAQQSFVDFAAYVTLFPQLIAGPIVRYTTVEAQLKNRIPDFEHGIHLFIQGLAQKVLIANNAGVLWEDISALGYRSLSPATAWLGIFAYGFQIYFDFCGYSNMAIGLGYMLGFHFPKNFDKPYISQSITEFWRRWHISLGTWFREYVYIPLGGNKNGRLLQLRNIFIVWFLTGIWHGAAWNFLLWGLYFALLLICEKLFLQKLLVKIHPIFRHLYALFFIFIGWVLFAFENLVQIQQYFFALFGCTQAQASIFSGNSFSYYLSENFILLIAATLFSTYIPEKITFYLKNHYPKLSLLKPFVLILLFLLSLAYIIDSSYNPFLYFRF